MSRILLFWIFILGVASVFGQFTIPLPQPYVPSNVVYLSPSGDDANPGTQNAPKKTFYNAVNTFPFGINNTPNSESYNEIVFLPGDYYPQQTMSQSKNYYVKESAGIKTYKNISLRGVGKVTIHGDSAINAGYNSLIALMGSHIYVRNITLKNSNYAGIMFVGGNRHCTNIEADSLIVDGASSHGCLFVLADTILVKNTIITNTCNLNSNPVASNCQWGSALKTEFCTQVTFKKNKVYRNWGEGINTSLSQGIYCFKNEAFDNYSVNFYLHSASKGIWDSNLVYNEDSLFWRGCHNPPGEKTPPGGFSAANELVCTYACINGGNNNACGGKYHCCAYNPYDGVFQENYAYRQTDSIFIYNNILLQADITLWDAFSGFLNYGFMKDIYIENNTVIGVSGRANLAKSPINLSFGTPFIFAQNLFVRNNIFTQDTSLTTYKAGLKVYIPSGVCNALNDGTILQINNNRWNTAKITTNNAIDITHEQVLTSLPVNILPNQSASLIPDNQHPYWIQSGISASWIDHDFLGNPRLGLTNVGAIERNSNVNIETIESAEVTLSPNPTSFILSIIPNFTALYKVEIWDINGTMLLKTPESTGEITLNIQHLNRGVYVLRVETKNHLSRHHKFVVVK